MESVEQCPTMLTMVDTRRRTAGIPHKAIHTTSSTHRRHLDVMATSILTMDTLAIHTGNRGTIDKEGAMTMTIPPLAVLTGAIDRAIAIIVRRQPLRRSTPLKLPHCTIRIMMPLPIHPPCRPIPLW